MEPILKTIAREYSGRYSDLKRICFLFPNKRCGIYLRKYLAEYGRTSEDMPHILTISDLMSQIARKTEASRIVQIFSLFNAYKEVVGDDVPLDFDAFRGWGETVLADFNTVDLNLVDPEEIFKNVKDYREISSNFLSEEQKEVMREYFGVEVNNESSSFWKNFEDPSKISNLKQKFLNLWQILAPLHQNFIRKLEEKGLGTTGSIYRLASEKIIHSGRKILPYEKIVIVGFNALSESERTLFKELQSQTGSPGFDDFADFIWDATGPVLKNAEFSASRFVNYNKKHFPMPECLEASLLKEEVRDYPDIEIISAPSLTSQAKVAAEVLRKYEGKEEKRMIADAEVGLILPDESLLSNMLYSLPENIPEINLTMGYSFRQTPVASFVSLLRRLYVSLRESKKGNVYYVKDLKMFFSHPYSYLLFPGDEIEALLDFINRYHKVSLSLEDISSFIESADPLLKFPSKKKGEIEIFVFLYNIFDKLVSQLESQTEKPEENEDISQIKIYREYVEALQEAVSQYHIESSPLSLMKMIDKIIATEKIGFEGEPLIGLQVMGTLETRSLDFNHVIILSMNEGIMPRKAVSSTFIPESLRRFYGLPPARYAEEIFSYYFFRLISRAKKVTLIYDGRTISGLRGGESRYLLQLREYAPKSRVREEAWQFKMQNRPKIDSSIEKTPDIRKLLEDFSIKGKKGKNFSASSLNTYRECQVKFFLQNLLNINSDPEQSEFMDAISIGNVLHNVMMEIYTPSNLQKRLLTSPIMIDKKFIETILDSPEIIRNLVEKNIYKYYYKHESGNSEKVESGVTDIITDQIIELVKAMITYDLSLAPFNLYGCEISENMQVILPSGRTVNFRFAIDRLDEIEVDGTKHLRIVDYKTGARKRKAKSIPDMFEGGSGSEQLFQLFTYAWLLGKLGIKDSENVMTEIYFVPDLIKGEGGLPEIDGTKVKSFKDFSSEFSEHFEKMVESIFTDPMFMQCREESYCTYCTFRSFCSK